MDKKPLYRKDNKTAFLHHNGMFAHDYRERRQSKKSVENEIHQEGMGGKKQRGVDYTPLYRFLHSKVGSNWNEVHSEAVARLDREEPIFHLVALHESNKRSIVRLNNNSYWSGLFVDDNNLLQLTSANLDINSIYPTCGCCTHTLNGKEFPNKYDPDRYLSLFDYEASYPSGF